MKLEKTDDQRYNHGKECKDNKPEKGCGNHKRTDDFLPDFCSFFCFCRKFISIVNDSVHILPYPLFLIAAR